MRFVVLAGAVVVFAACAPEPLPPQGGEDLALPPEAPWTPAQADLLFMSNRDGNAEISVLAAGSSEWKNLTRHPAQDNWPEWSPDGRRIAFQSDRGGNLDIWVMNADGSNAVQLTDDPAHDYLPAWSPDGTRLTFASWRHEAGDGPEPAIHHYVMNSDGSQERRLFADSPGMSAAASWTPDGRSFLMARKPLGGTGADIYLLDTEGAVLRRLTEDEPTDGAPVFSPDGSQIAFYSDTGETSALVILDADGTHRRTLLSDGQHWYPRWSPDGRWLVYTAANPAGSDNLDVRATLADGTGDAILLAGGPGREAEGQWRPRQP
ncbi:MAG: hypothetical protein OEW19_13810 [Acidobacteriota bacterium]|nr:hypothetical protein [Acidobacteriota bacterium]